MKKLVPCVLVCALTAASCRGLCRLGVEVANELQLPLSAVSVLPAGIVTDKVAKQMQTLHNITSAMDTEIHILFSDSPALAVAVHASQIGAVAIVCDDEDMPGQPLFSVLHRLLPQVDIIALDRDGRRIMLAKESLPCEAAL